MTVTITPELLADLRKKARDAEDETDCTQPRDIDMLSPKADKIETMRAELTPAVVLALLDRIDALARELSPVPIGRLLPEPLIIPARWACDTCGARQVYQGESEPPLHECKPADSGGSE